MTRWRSLRSFAVITYTGVQVLLAQSMRQHPDPTGVRYTDTARRQKNRGVFCSSVYLLKTMTSHANQMQVMHTYNRRTVTVTALCYQHYTFCILFAELYSIYNSPKTYVYVT